MGPLVALVIAIVIISAVVGAIAQFLNKLNEANAPPARRPGGPARPPAGDRDMDRFLAEIDRLRKKNTDGANPSASPPPPAKPDRSRPAVAAPVARPVPTTRGRPRVVAELAEPAARPGPTARRGVDRGAMAAPPAPVLPGTLSPGATRPEDLPVASVVMPTGSTGTPVTGAARFARRPLAASKTALGRDLTALLASGNGVATAVILQEILGPPKSKKR